MLATVCSVCERANQRNWQECCCCGWYYFTINKSWLAMWSRNLHDYIHVSIPAPLRFEHLCNGETRQPWRWIFLANFHIYVPENAIRLAKKQNNNDRKKLKRNCKILFKVKCIQISHKKCLIWPAIERVRYREVSATCNVNWDLKIMFAIESYPL